MLKKQDNGRNSGFFIICFAVISVFLLFPIGYINNISLFMKTVYTWAPLPILLASLLFVAYRRSSYRIDSSLVILIVFCLSLAISSLNDSGRLVYAFQLICKYLSLFLLSYIIISSTYRYKLIIAIFVLFSSITIANTASVFMFPNALYADARGVQACWLLGGDNFSIRFYILTVLFAAFIPKSRFRIYALSITLINYCLFVLVRFCGMGILSLCIITVIMLAPIHSKIVSNVKCRYSIYLSIFVFIFIVILGHIDFITWVINLLGKDITLSARTRIWDMTFHLLDGNAIIGYGALRGQEIESLLIWPGMTNVHNSYLMILLFGGIILLVFYILFQFQSCKLFDRKEKSFAILAVIACSFAIALHSQIEGNYIDITILIFSIINHIGRVGEIDSSSSQPIRYDTSIS